jgi:hypothetical protein
MKVIQNVKPEHPLRRIRDQYNLTGGEMGAILGLRPGLIALVENGYQGLSKSATIELCDKFGLDPISFKKELDDHKKQLARFALEKIGRYR